MAAPGAGVLGRLRLCHLDRAGSSKPRGLSLALLAVVAGRRAYSLVAGGAVTLGTGYRRRRKLLGPVSTAARAAASTCGGPSRGHFSCVPLPPTAVAYPRLGGGRRFESVRGSAKAAHVRAFSFRRTCAAPWKRNRENAAVRRTAFILASILALAVLAGVLHFADVDPVVVFVVAAVALGGLAWAISIATESVGERYGPAVTGALQSTLGNLPELFIVLFALSAGEIVVARTSILGSLFANGLLVLGPGDRRGRARSARRRDAVPAAAAAGHGDAAPARDRDHRPARPLASGRRPCKPSRGGDLGRRRDRAARRLRTVGRGATSARTSRSRGGAGGACAPGAAVQARARRARGERRRGGARVRLVHRRARPGRQGARASRRRSRAS